MLTSAESISDDTLSHFCVVMQVASLQPGSLMEGEEGGGSRPRGP